MADLLALSSRFIDEGVFEGPRAVNRITTELSEVADGIAVVEAFSHVVAFATDEGLLLFDTSLEAFAPAILKSLRAWSAQPVHSIVYTHGHVDHVGGAAALIDEARERGAPRPAVVGHENVPGRFNRYELTNGYNLRINQRQFGRGGLAGGERFGPSRFCPPDVTFRERAGLRAGSTRVELRHAKGETDDHLWAWVPERRAVLAGDFLTWVFPNAGNPQKVQRYPLEWARALREMASLEPDLLLPAHGLPIAGRERIRGVLDDVATALESVVDQTLERMNAGEPLDVILHGVRPPAELMERPYLQPVYDEPEFVVRNVWRLYGGWYDGNPARLKPAPDADVAAELARLAGGPETLASRARELAEAGNVRLACHLAELAVQADPQSRESHAARAEVYTVRRRLERSLMARGIYRAAAEESEEVARSRR